MTRQQMGLAAVVLLAIAPVCSGQALNTQVDTPPPRQSSSGPMTNTDERYVTGLTDQPIFAGEVVHVTVFDAPDFSITTRVSESGDIAYPMLGVLHLAGLDSQSAADLIANKLKGQSLMHDPKVMVTVNATSTGITVLGEVGAPGIYPPSGKSLLSDVIAAAGGMTSHSGRVIEISSVNAPDKTTQIPWDPSMHNTSNYDRPVHPGDRVLVKPCGVIYVGGHVARPGAYSLCGSQQVTVSEMVAAAGGITSYTSTKHTLIVRLQPDGSKVVQELDLKKVQTGRLADPVLRDDDIIYVSPSPMKEALSKAVSFVFSLAAPVLYTYHP